MDQRQIELQRDLYRLLLSKECGTSGDIAELLSQALGLIVRMTGARIGYIELRNARGEKWWSTHHCSGEDVETIRERISSGIIAESISLNETIVTPSAFLDPRFNDFASVETGRIEAVLCSPFHDGETFGVIYLQGGSDIELNAAHCLMDTELFTRHITPLLKRFRFQLLDNPAKINLKEKYRLDNIVGNSAALQDVLLEAMAIAELDATVLLTGESGTGKGLFAEAIHKNSPRKHKSFVHLNCANLPEQLVESELFGAVKGAYSSAHVSMKGKISSAQGGTLFLDEIGELPVGVQSKLLQFLENGCYYPLGSQVLHHADVRIITASNVDFEAAIQNGTFRADLYYRISVFPLEIPPLRSRAEDIPALLGYFCEYYCDQFKMPKVRFSPDAVLIFQESDWPGNVRQMQNKIQQAILRARAEAATVIEPRHLLGHVPASEDNARQVMSYREGKDYWERCFIKTRLEKHDWNVSEAARTLGLSRSHMNNLIHTHGLSRTKMPQKKNRD